MYDIIVDHADQAVARLSSSYNTKPSVVSLVRVLADQIQLLENATAHVNSGRLLYGGQAKGAQLDVLGQIIGLPRSGLDDATYTVLLYGTIAKNNSDATLVALLGVITLIYQTGAIWIGSPNSPGAYPAQAPAQVQIGIGTPQTEPRLFGSLLKIVNQSIGAAISVASIVQFEAGGVFACDGPQLWVRGPSALDGSLGGPAAGLIFNNGQS